MTLVGLMQNAQLWAHFYIAYTAMRKGVKDSIIRLLNLDMQRQSGRETLHLLRAIISNHHLLIVVLTTSTTQLDDEILMGLGSSDFLIRPIKRASSVLMLKRLAM